MWKAVLEVIRPFPLSTSTKKLLVGVSGGADSLALLHILWRQFGADRLVVAHLNHQLRPEAGEDSVFVAETAASWEIPCHIEQVDVANLATEAGLSLEAAGRLARYQFLADKAGEIGAAVMVAHHADDQAETVLLHLIRGSGGLRGMKGVSQVPGSEGIVLLRPFLTITRAEIEAYCARHHLEPRIDASNEDTQFTRNRIRHELIPLLQTFNPRIQEKLRHLATISADEEAILQYQFDQIWQNIIELQREESLLLDRQQFQALAVAWQRFALRRAVQLMRPSATEISFQSIEQARNLILENQTGTEAWLPGGLLMRIAGDTVSFGEDDGSDLANYPQLFDESGVRLAVPGEVALANGWMIEASTVKTISMAEIRQNADRWQVFVALDSEDILRIRPSQLNERFQPLGMRGHSQKIVDLLSNRKVNRAARLLWPVVATDELPVWIVGQHVDERSRVTKKSPRIVKLVCYRGEG